MSAATFAAAPACGWCGIPAPGPRYPGRDSDGDPASLCTDCAVDEPDRLVDPDDARIAAADLAGIWEDLHYDTRRRDAQMVWLRRRVALRIDQRIEGDAGPQALAAALVAVLDLLDETYLERGFSSVTSLQVREAIRGGLES